MSQVLHDGTATAGSPRLQAAAESARTEAEVRELARAKLLAQENYKLLLARNTADLSEDQRIDLMLEMQRAEKALGDTAVALWRAV
jgi:hypothetical protein